MAADDELRSLIGAVVEQRHDAAVSDVRRLRELHPDAPRHELVGRLVRRCARDLAIGGAMSGGAAASPSAGPGIVVGAIGAQSTYGVSRLGELIMAVGILHGFDHRDSAERVTWVAGVLRASEGAAMGLTGVAARAGARGGARLLQRVPAAAVQGAGSTSRLAGRLVGRGGPWGLVALVPYGIGAGVGAAGNAALAWSVGRAADRWFAGHSGPVAADGDPLVPDDGDEGPLGLWDVEFVEERIVDDGA